MESSPYGAVYLSPPPDNSWRSMLPWPSANHLPRLLPRHRPGRWPSSALGAL
ncbi:hypothetical protein GOODEAATRI_013543 [Goodea atripinnis]|uniref:Uncharacterized protein n=1 Tax=Goodea atripinnis TaxID=208336 RepID=A0ABV0MHW5_9TELE